MGSGSNKKSQYRMQLFSQASSAESIGALTTNALTTNAVVFSTDKPKSTPLPSLCAGCRRQPNECICKSNRKTLLNGKIHARIERKGRGGKTVTILERFAPNRALLEELCTALKKRLGAGGAAIIDGGHRPSETGRIGAGPLATGRIEIQGERATEALEFAQAWLSA